MLLEADWVLPMSGPPFSDGAVAVADGRIVGVGPAAKLRAQWPDDPVRLFPGCVLMPGLINCHSHLEYSAFRGFSPPCGFGEWMLRLLLARRKLDADDYAVSASWGARECARAGMTYLADTSFEGWTSARAAGEAGLRARIHLEVIGFDDRKLPQTMARMEQGLEALRVACGPLVDPGLSPHAPYTVSQRLYRELARFARREQLHLATHIAESKAEVELLERGTGAIAQAYKAAELWKGRRWLPPGVSPLVFVDHAGALDSSTLAVHCVQLEPHDISVLAASGAAVAHCPRSNGRLQCGTAPVAELLAAGVRVGLGTDSLASNDRLDLFAEMRSALELSSSRSVAGSEAAGRAAQPVAVLDAGAAVHMATRGGAAALGLAEAIGSLDPGKKADAIAVQLPCRPGAQEELSTILVETAVAADVRMTMVDGIVIHESTAGAPPAYDDLDASFAAVRRKLSLGPGLGSGGAP